MPRRQWSWTTGHALTRASFSRLAARGEIEIGRKGAVFGLHEGAGLKARQLIARFARGQIDAFLVRQRFVNGLALQTVGHQERDEIRDHERHDDGVVARHFEDHDHRSERRTDDAGEGRSHAD